MEAGHTEKKHQKYLYQDKQRPRLSKIGTYVAFSAGRVLFHGPVQYEGLENLAAAEPSVIVPNHPSALDIPIVGFAARQAAIKPPSFIAKIELVDELPVFRALLPRLGAYYVDRETMRSYYETSRHIKNSIEQGRSVVSFHEGRRRPEDTDIDFLKSLGRIAAKQMLRVNPVGIYGSGFKSEGRSRPVGVVIGQAMVPEKDQPGDDFTVEINKRATELRQDAKALAGY